MNKIKENPLENFNKNDLLQFSKCINKLMRKRILCLTVVLSFVSCSSVQKYYRADFVKLNKKIEGEFLNDPSDVSFSTSKSVKITDLFGLKTNGSSIKLKTIGENLILTYTDELGKIKHNSYPGDFKDKSFELYLKYETKTIPVLLVTKSMDYLRFSVLEDNTLVINHDFCNEGMFLLFGAGNSYKNELIYKSVK